MSTEAMEDLDLKKVIRQVPFKGVSFYDIAPLLASPRHRKAVTEAFALRWTQQGVHAIVGLDSRGFIFGTSLADALNLPFVMVRKRGKLPGPVWTVSYDLEYGKGELEIQQDAFPWHSERVLIVDDVLATGGTAAAAVSLVEEIGLDVLGFAFVIEIAGLQGRKKLPQVPIQSLLISS